MKPAYKEVITDCCASWTSPESLFRQDFRMAHNGIAKASPSVSLNTGVHADLKNEF